MAGVIGFFELSAFMKKDVYHLKKRGSVSTTQKKTNIKVINVIFLDRKISTNSTIFPKLRRKSWTMRLFSKITRSLSWLTSKK